MTSKSRASILMAIIMVTSMLITTIAQTNSALVVAVPESIPFIQSAFADHGKEILLSGKDSSLLPLTSGEGGNQVKVIFDYNVQDPLVANNFINGVMQLYSSNGTLLKTSSSPTSIRLDDGRGTLAVATPFQNLKTEGLTAKIALINSERKDIVSNELLVNVGVAGSKLSPQHQDVTQTEIQQTYNDELNTKLQPSSDIPSSDILPPPRTEVENKEVDKANIQALIGQDSPPAQLKPETERIATIVMQPLKTNVITSEACNFSENECIQSLEKPANQQAIKQDQIMHTTLEICNDDLDNDIDGKVDIYDDDCSQDIKTSITLPQGEIQSFDSKQKKWEEGDVQQFDDRDDDKDDDKDDEDNKDRDED